MGSDNTTKNVTRCGHELLNMHSARELLRPVTQSEVAELTLISNTNDVFRAETSNAETFYVKFHTADWYKDAEDTRDVVMREQIAAELLKHHGISLEVCTWSDCSRDIVP